MTRYFRMMQDVYVPGRWHLTDPVDQHGQKLDWMFSAGESVQLDGPVRVSFSEFAKPGNPVDYCELDGDAVPVVHARVAEAIAALAPSDVQFVSVEIEGWPDQFRLVNVTRSVRCIDDKRCKEVQIYTPDCEEVFRSRVGEYRAVHGMRIDPERVGGARIFRTWGWLVAIIVSEEIKQALERIGTVGVRFEEV